MENCRRAYKREWMRRKRAGLPSTAVRVRPLTRDEVAFMVAVCGDMSQSEVAHIFGVTQQSIDAIERDAVRRLWRRK